MQLNIHVPKDREALLARLETEASTSGKPKNQVVLDALAAYLAPKRGGRQPHLRTWPLGIVGDLHRAEIYEERIKRAAR